jgi:hypothetical protein
MQSAQDWLQDPSALVGSAGRFAAIKKYEIK